jgi:glycosyltransferase involved in cell wall biosynthesis
MFQGPRKRLRILVWHIHGSYLYYLVQSAHEFFLPVKPGKPTGYGGRTEGFPWPDNVHDVPAEDVRNLNIDCVVFQSPKNYLEDQYEILSAGQQQLPRIYIEHDPPRESPTDTCHPVDDPNILLVHVTHFNNLMWDSRRTPTRVINHGVLIPGGIIYTGDIERGLVIVNDLPKRGRRLGLDIFEKVRTRIPLDLAGLASEKLGGLGPLPHQKLLELAGHYRFVFNPIRYTSMALSICEAMMIGLPIIGLATTEMVTAIQNGLSGYVETDIERLIEHMQRLLVHPEVAQRLGQGARRQAMRRFNIQRFLSDWDETFTSIMGMAVERRMPVAQGERV